MNCYLARVHNNNQPFKYTTILATSYKDALASFSMLYDFFENVTCIGESK